MLDVLTRCHAVLCPLGCPGRLYPMRKKVVTLGSSEVFCLSVPLSVCPFVCLSVCHWGSEAESFLCHLAKKSRNVEGQQNTVEFLNYWRRRFSVSLQRCNAKVVLKKISRLSCGENEECRLFDRDIHISVH